MKSDIIYWLIFIGYIVYNYLFGIIYNKKNWWYWIYMVIIVLSLIGLVYKDIGSNDRSKVLLFALFIVIGTGLLTHNMFYLGSGKIDKEKIDNLIEDQQRKTNWSTTLFIIAGLLAYITNTGIIGSDCTDILCDDINIFIFIIANICVYQFLNMLKLTNSWGFKSDTSSESNIIMNIGILTLWQIYMYFLAGGFSDSSIMTSIKSKISDNYNYKSDKTMYEFFSFISVFVIIAFIVSTEVLIKNCNTDKKLDSKINTIKNITGNMIGTTITSIIIISVLQ